MQYTMEFLENGSLEVEEGTISKESSLETLLRKLDAEKFVNLALVHKNQNILTISGGRQHYIVMHSDNGNSRVYELCDPTKKGGALIPLRTGHTIGKFNPEMVNDIFTTLNVMKEFYHHGRRHVDYNWKPLI